MDFQGFLGTVYGSLGKFDSMFLLKLYIHQNTYYAFCRHNVSWRIDRSFGARYNFVRRQVEHAIPKTIQTSTGITQKIDSFSFKLLVIEGSITGKTPTVHNLGRSMPSHWVAFASCLFIFVLLGDHSGDFLALAKHFCHECLGFC
jgi:hypothetical protein